MKKFFKDFKAFISRGSIIDLAVGVIIGGAFTAIVTALTNKILMPIINWILMLIVGGNGMDSIYTFLKRVDQMDSNGNYILNDAGERIADLTKSIYIDWGAFIIAIIDFLLIALVLFLIIRAMMRAQNLAQKTKSKLPTKEEKKELKERGVNFKNKKEVLAKTQELRAEKLAKEEAEKAEAEKNKKPTTDELLADILTELKKSNEK